MWKILPFEGKKHKKYNDYSENKSQTQRMEDTDRVESRNIRTISIEKGHCSSFNCIWFCTSWKLNLEAKSVQFGYVHSWFRSKAESNVEPWRLVLYIWIWPNVNNQHLHWYRIRFTGIHFTTSILRTAPGECEHFGRKLACSYNWGWECFNLAPGAAHLFSMTLYNFITSYLYKWSSPDETLGITAE